MTNTTTANMTHSPLNLPLTLDLDRPMYEATLHEQESPEGTWVIAFQGSKDKAIQIMTAVNSHQALVEALEAILKDAETSSQSYFARRAKKPNKWQTTHLARCANARAALALAKGGNK